MILNDTGYIIYSNVILDFYSRSTVLPELIQLLFKRVGVLNTDILFSYEPSSFAKRMFYFYDHYEFLTFFCVNTQKTHTYINIYLFICAPVCECVMSSYTNLQLIFLHFKYVSYSKSTDCKLLFSVVV